MAQSEALINCLKKELKAHNLTYADIAKGLTMSEANIKRLFSSKRFSLDRLEDICRLMDMDLVDLIRSYESTRSQISYLSPEQEKELVSDIRLLLVAVCARNHMSFEEIIENYDISENECVQYLAKLDRLQLIELLPNNRIKLRISNDFHWLPNGPIIKLFKQSMQTEFLSSNFSKSGELQFFLSGPLCASTHEVIMNKLKRLSQDFNELHQQDMTQTRNTINAGLFVAFRPWEFSLFKQLRR